jgi:hypothetical protein
MVMRVHGERLIQAETLLVLPSKRISLCRKIVPTTAVRQAPENYQILCSPSAAPGRPSHVIVPIEDCRGSTGAEPQTW